MTTLSNWQKWKTLVSVSRRANIRSREISGKNRAFHGSSRDVPEWPKSADPSPYEIFGLPRGKPDAKKLRKIYIQLAKKYHPDAKSSMSAQVKNERFRKIMSAYEILQSDDKRLRYEYSQGTSYHAPHNYGKNPRNPYSFNGHFYGGFEDGRPEDWGFDPKARERMEDEELQQKLSENRYKLVIIIAIGASLFGAAQIYRQLLKYKDRSDAAELSTLQTRVQLLRARANYGLGDSQDDRIERFLHSRNSSNYYDPYENEPELLLADPSGNLTVLDISSENNADNRKKNEK